MLNLVTGNPGAGKTQFVIATLLDQSKKEPNRQIYFHNIRGCRVPGWIELPDLTKWYDLEPGAIVVADECQRVFKPRASTAVVPQFVERLETHRHGGIDLWLMTQKPGLVDRHVRMLTGCHWHLHRPLGFRTAKVFRWPDCQENPAGKREQAAAMVDRYTFRSDVEKLYDSADLHTHKATVPTRFYLFVIIPILLAVGLYYGSSMLRGKASKEDSPIEGLTDKKGRGGNPASRLIAGVVQGDDRGQVKPISPAEAAAEYVRVRIPVIPDYPHTAERYRDAVAKPASVPVPVGCVASSTRCVCYTAQATPLPMREDLCRSAVAGLSHWDWIAPASEAGRLRPAEAAPAQGLSHSEQVARERQ